eukprot:1748097-Lingulodinium_polyedra.AAC.1
MAPAKTACARAQRFGQWRDCGFQLEPAHLAGGDDPCESGSCGRRRTFVGGSPLPPARCGIAEGEGGA